MGDKELWWAIYDLYELIVEETNEEVAYQCYFEKHPVVFSMLGYDAAAPFDKRSACKLPFDEERGFRPEPDFICGVRRTGEITVFELKTPFQAGATTSRSDGNREKFRATIETYIAQATEYADSIREREAAREVVCDTLQLPQISSYSVCLVYGLSSRDDGVSIARLAEKRIPKTEILPYDVLLERLIDRYAVSRTDVDTRAGWTFCWHVVVAPVQVHERAYICDIGQPERDRVSLYVEDTNLVLECIDSSRHLHRAECGYRPNEQLFVRFEFGTDEPGILISVNINNEEVDLRVGRKPLQVNPDRNHFYVGSDIHGSRGACFKLLEAYNVSKTLKISDRLGTYHYFKSKKSVESCIEFNGTSFLCRRSADGSLIQNDNDRRPIYRTSAFYPVI